MIFRILDHVHAALLMTNYLTIKTLNFWLSLILKLRSRFAVTWKMDISLITEASSFPLK